VLVQAPWNLYVGGLALPALLFALFRSGPASFERRFVAIAALLFLATGIATYASFDPWRYPLLGVVCIWFAACSMLDEAGAWLREEMSRRGPVIEASTRYLPLLAVLLLWLLAFHPLAWWGGASQELRSFREAGTRERFQQQGSPPDGRPSWDQTARTFCDLLERDALVASPNPWAFYVWCGNAGLLIPPDLDSETWLARYLEEQRPAYLIVTEHPAFEVVRSAAALERITEHHGRTLYRVPDPGPPPWHAPPRLPR
jgi:hypothetical protein